MRMLTKPVWMTSRLLVTGVPLRVRSPGSMLQMTSPTCHSARHHSRCDVAQGFSYNSEYLAAKSPVLGTLKRPSAGLMAVVWPQIGGGSQPWFTDSFRHLTDVLCQLL